MGFHEQLKQSFQNFKNVFINPLQTGKQGVLTAGDNITIETKYDYTDITSDCVFVANSSALPSPGTADIFYITEDDNKVYTWNTTDTDYDLTDLSVSEVNELPSVGSDTVLYVLTTDNSVWSCTVTPDVISADSESYSFGNGINITNNTITTKVDGTTITFNSNGEMVASSSASSLDTLTDVNITSLSNDQILQYDSTSGKWVNTNNTGGATIDDTTTSSSTVWSSSKVNTEIGNKTEINDSNTTLTNTWSASKINSLISGLVGIDFEVVQALPTQDISTHTIYLVPKSTAATNNVYDEYIYVNNSWELIGDTTVDLSNYYTKTQTNTLLNDKQNTLTAGDNITIQNNVISASAGSIKWQEIYPSS